LLYGDASQVTDFGDYVQSYPNYYTLAENVQFFAAHGVKGVFGEQLMLSKVQNAA
jgi:hypothetical protein